MKTLLGSVKTKTFWLGLLIPCLIPFSRYAFGMNHEIFPILIMDWAIFLGCELVGLLTFKSKNFAQRALGIGLLVSALLNLGPLIYRTHYWWVIWWQETLQSFR